MAEGKRYISWSTRFDTYKGELNWQDLSLSERTTIARFELDGIPEDLEIHEFVMGSSLRRIQFDGLRTVIIRVALALEGKLDVRFEVGDGTKYSLILSYLQNTALGQELSSLLNGTAGEQTTYRMGELEYLTQSGSKPSPLDKLLDLPQDLRLHGILELLKPRGAFDPKQPKTSNRESDAIDINKLPFTRVMRLLDAKRIDIRASYAGSLQAVSHGIVKVGPAGRLASIGYWAAPAAGLIAAFLVAWWWLPIGLITGMFAFHYSRTSAVNAVLRRAATDESFFELMRNHQIIWLEDGRPR